MYYRKTYTTENAYRSHINSKKHRETELKLAHRRDAEPEAPQTGEPIEVTTDLVGPPPQPVPEKQQLEGEAATPKPQTIDDRIASLRSRISPLQCLFCTAPAFNSIDENVSHMASAHSFFIPDLEYLTDLSGLLSFLGERIAVDNTCIFCSKKSREFRSLDAVRKHMLDKGHCKIAYDTESERLAVSDFYDFSKSYPAPPGEKKGSSKRRVKVVVPDAEFVEDDCWEDVDGDGEGSEFDEAAEERVTEPEDSENEEDGSDNEADRSQITYGDTVYELVLPSGARIGHRSLRRYYKQSFANPLPGRVEDPNSGVGLVRRLIGDKENSTLVPVKGGYGAFGDGTMTVKARSRGEAKEAGRHIREFRDQKRREEFKTKVAFIHNHQKHFRDPLLQVRSSSSNLPSFIPSLTFTPIVTPMRSSLLFTHYYYILSLSLNPIKGFHVLR